MSHVPQLSNLNAARRLPACWHAADAVASCLDAQQLLLVDMDMLLVVATRVL